MNLPAEAYPLSQEEQGRLLACVYAFILSDKFTRKHQKRDFQRTNPPAKTRQPHLTRIIQVTDAQALLPLEAEE